MLEIHTGTAWLFCAGTLQPDEGDIGERKVEKIAKFRGIRKSRGSLRDAINRAQISGKACALEVKYRGLR